MDYQRNFYQIKNNDEIFLQVENERKSVGYFRLPYENIDHVKKFAKKVKKNNIVVVGIGGSSLGSKAIYKFLRTSFELKKLFFFDTIDPLKVNYLISQINLEDSFFVIISKSGHTIEPISILKYLRTKIVFNNSNAAVVTGIKTPLYNFAKKNKLEVFILDQDIGGRFSVFSPVGILPLAMAGVDVDKLLHGCREVNDSFFAKDYYFDHIMNKARFLVENKNRFVNNIIFSYSSVFSDFNKWYVQLWAESLGKININGTRQGLTPIALTGPEDQHSFLQLIIDGVRNKTVTFFKIENLNEEPKIPIDKHFYEFEPNLSKEISLNELINFQAESNYEALLSQKDIPCDIITINAVDEFSIAKLMYRFQLLVSCVGAFLQINPYDQPGVELGKDILIKKILKND